MAAERDEVESDVEPEDEQLRPRPLPVTVIGGRTGKGWHMPRPGELDDDAGNSGP